MVKSGYLVTSLIVSGLFVAVVDSSVGKMVRDDHFRFRPDHFASRGAVDQIVLEEAAIDLNG